MALVDCLPLIVEVEGRGEIDDAPGIGKDDGGGVVKTTDLGGWR